MADWDIPQILDEEDLDAVQGAATVVGNPGETKKISRRLDSQKSDGKKIDSEAQPSGI